MYIVAEVITNKLANGEEKIPYGGTIYVELAANTPRREFTFAAEASRGMKRMNGLLRHAVAIHALTVKEGEEVFLQLEDGSIHQIEKLDKNKLVWQQLLYQAVAEGVEAVGKGAPYLGSVSGSFACEESSTTHSKTFSFGTAVQNLT